MIVNSSSQFINHQFREYISKLYYNTNDPLEPFGILSTDSIQLLSLGLEFNNILKIGDIPKSVKKLWVNNINYQLTEGIFPEGLLELRLNGFNQPLSKNVLPSSLKYLELERYDQPLDSNVIPNNCKYLNIQSYSGRNSKKDELVNAIPPSVSKLVLGKSIQLGSLILPSTIQKLTLFGFNSPLRVGDLGSTIIELYLRDYNQPLSSGAIPSSVISLRFNKFNQIIKQGDLSNIKVIDFGPCFNQIIYPNTLPETLETITFGYGYRRNIIDDIFPSSIKLVRFRNRRMKASIDPTLLNSNKIKFEFGSLF